MRLRAASYLLFCLTLVLLSESPAAGHQGDPNFRSVINAVMPAKLGEGLELEVLNYDDNITMRNGSGREIEILGYDGEPYARVAAGGLVEVNLNSPSYYLNQDRYANVELPPRADAEAEADWQREREDGIFSWHDHRSHYMAEGIPVQVDDEAQRTKIFDYVVPLRIDGQPAKIQGTLYWAGRSDKIPPAPFIGLVAFTILGTVLIVILRKKRRIES